MHIYLDEKQQRKILESDYSAIIEKIQKHQEIVQESAYESYDVNYSNIYDILEIVVSKEQQDKGLILEISPYDTEDLTKGKLLVRFTKQIDLEGALLVYFAQFEYDLETNPTLFNKVIGVFNFQPVSDVHEELEELQEEIDKKDSVEFDITFN